MSKPPYTSTVLITGGTSGLGYHTALSLAAQVPATTLIVLASRSDTQSSAASINTSSKQFNVLYAPLDLGILASVRAFASTWSTSSHPPITALVLNAGIQLPGATAFTPDGIEKHFGVNHLSHALLFHLLTPYLSPAARIVVVTSGLHDPVQGKGWGIVTRYSTPLAAAEGKGSKASAGRERYATSKSANAIWAFALSSHLPAASPKTVIAFDPGLMFGTAMGRDAGFLVRFMANWVLPALVPVLRVLVNKNINPPAESGANMAWVVVSGEVEGKKRVYFEGRKEREASVQARSGECQEELWKWTVERVSADEEEKAKFEKVE